MSADFSDLKGALERVEGADWLHLDAMDGRFVQNITFGPLIVGAVRKLSSKHLDVHLMIEQPERYVGQFAKACGSNATITMHYEACSSVKDAIERVKSYGLRAGLAIKPSTPVSVLRPFLKDLDLALVMTVEPGFGGQSFLSEQLAKVEFLAKERSEHEYSYDIEVDGGVNRETIKACKEAGANVFVAGSAVFNSPSPGKEVEALRNLVSRA